jgi:hypothetical protein
METVVPEKVCSVLEQIDEAKAVILFVSASINDDAMSPAVQMGMIYVLDHVNELLSSAESIFAFNR